MTDSPITPPNASQLEQYLAGEASPDDSVRTVEWIGADPVRQTMALGLKSLNKTRFDRQCAPNVDALWDRVNARISVPYTGQRGTLSLPASQPQLSTPELSPERSVRQAPPFLRGISKYSARLGLGLFAVVMMAAIGSRFLMDRSSSDSASTTEEYHEYTTSNGQVATVNLGDGTRVTLAPGSELRYSRSFGSKGRDVYLRGEAYFDIAHRPAQPFVVFTERSSTQVLGTQFSVRQYRGDSAVRLEVVSGKVAFMTRDVASSGRASERAASSADSNVVIVSGGEQAQLALGHIVLSRGTGAVPTWLSGTLAYTDAPLRTILIDLQRWYGVTFQFDDASIGERRLTASFNDSTLTREALDAMMLPLGIRYEREGARITLFSR